MMMTLLLLKSRMKNFYEKHYRVARSVLKAFLVLGILLIITQRMDYQEWLGEYWLLIVLSLLCAVTPDLVALLSISAVTLAELHYVSPLLAFSVLLILVIYYTLFGRLAEKQSVILIAIPVLSVFQFGYVVPIVAALFFSPIMLPALMMGVFLQFVLQGAQEYAIVMSRVTEETSPVASLQYIANYLNDNAQFLLVLVAFVLTFVCVYYIRRMKIQYASQVAILVGAIVILSAMLLGNIVFELDVNLLTLIIAIVISVAVAIIIQFFHIILDYRGTRKLQFEDDEYYYYVTAVPKYKVAVADKTVTIIAPEEEDENLDLKMELEKELGDMDSM